MKYAGDYYHSTKEVQLLFSFITFVLLLWFVLQRGLLKCLKLKTGKIIISYTEWSREPWGYTELSPAEGWRETRVREVLLPINSSKLIHTMTLLSHLPWTRRRLVRILVLLSDSRAQHIGERKCSHHRTHCCSLRETHCGF